MSVTRKMKTNRHECDVARVWSTIFKASLHTGERTAFDTHNTYNMCQVKLAFRVRRRAFLSAAAADNAEDVADAAAVGDEDVDVAMVVETMTMTMTLRR